LQNISDSELIKRAQNRKNDLAIGTQAVGELYDRYQESIYRYIWLRVSDPQLAEDLTSEVFTRMVISLPDFRDTGAPIQAWLFRIARNLVIDTYRKASMHRELPIEHVINNSVSEHDPTQIVEDQIFIEQVQAGLQELKPLKQDVLILRFIAGLSLKEVASILGKTVGSIKVTQHRALNEIRILLRAQTGEQNE
jgi:RNA polymerase sigma-70 factor (ECF subfamily)